MRLRSVPTSRPTPAERMRSILAAAHSMSVVTGGRRHEIHRLDGTAVMHRVHLHGPDAEETSGTRMSDVPIRVELTDIAPTPVRDRLRARVSLTGVTAGPFDPDGDGSACVLLHHAVIKDVDGHTFVPWGQLETAEPDPLATCEASLLHHLAGAHADHVAELARLVVPDAERDRPVRVLPVRLDRYGVTLRLERAAAWNDVRLPFPTPADDPSEVGVRILALLSAGRGAFRSGTP
ncbi:DUF2470 domain-containing protein [Streptomyces sp. NPDC056600]|uniref:DUF2470 domain-containing protein n=1 Tax=Streptomyces sp. NPDC056600 TaxID=3345874 RepID=UPI0036B92D15